MLQKFKKIDVMVIIGQAYDVTKKSCVWVPTLPKH